MQKQAENLKSNSVKNPTFRIAVATYKRPDDLAHCLAALAPQVRKKENFKLVIVNDCTPSADYDALINQYEDVIEYRVRKENGGPGLARATAFEDATEDYLVCTDDDCVPPDAWLDTLEAIVEVNPEVDLIAGAVEPVWTCKPGWYQKLLAVPVSYPMPHFADDTLLTAVTANCAFKRHTYELVGGFTDDLRGATEDHFLTKRIIESGGSYMAPEFWITGHKAENTLRGISSRFYGYGYGGAHTAVLKNSWQLADVGSDGTIAGALRMITQKTQRAWKDEKNCKNGKLERVVFTLLNCLMALQYERGWRAGLKRLNTGWPAKLPKAPKLVDRYVDFTV
ncbi:MAG: glycosyltransferase family A protein [Pseudomonadota bacterium]